MSTVMIKGVIFDLDDTLYNERTYVESAMKCVADYFAFYWNMDAGQVYLELMELLDANGRGKVFDLFLARHEIVENVKKIVEVYRNTAPQLMLYEDAAAVIEALRSYHIPMAIITDGCSKVQHNKVAGLNIIDKFDEIIITDDYENAAKPSEKPYKMASEKLGLQPSECIYIGDNPEKDFVGARAVGMHTARIVRPVGDHMTATARMGYEAEFIIHSLTEILGLESAIWNIKKFSV